MLKKENKNPGLIFLLLLLPVATAAYIWSGVSRSVLFLPATFLIILSVSWLTVQLKLQVYLLKLMALLLPFSFEYPIATGSMLQFPGEILTGIAALTVVIEIILQRASLKEYFSGEIKYAVPIMLFWIAGMLFSTMPAVSAKFILINCTYLLVYLFLLKRFFNLYPRLFHQMIILYSLSFSLVIVYASYRFLQYQLNPEVTRGIFRPWYKDHTITGASAALLSAYWLAGSYSGKHPFKRLFMAFAGFFFLYAVFLTHSRAAILSLVPSAVVFGLLNLKINPRILALGGIAAFIMLIGLRKPIYDKLYYNRFVSNRQNIEWSAFIKSTGNVTTDDSNVERLNRWYAGIKMFELRPLTGFGPGTYQFKYIPYQNKQLTNRLTVTNPYKIPENSGGTAHSEYILALSETGLPGFIALIVFLARLIGLAFIKARNHPDRKKIMVVFTALSTYIFHSFFNNFLNTDKFAFLFWGMAAGLITVYEANHDKELLQEHQNIL